MTDANIAFLGVFVDKLRYKIRKCAFAIEYQARVKRVLGIGIAEWASGTTMNPS
jgi:hypothetical protein